MILKDWSEEGLLKKNKNKKKVKKKERKEEKEAGGAGGKERGEKKVLLPGWLIFSLLNLELYQSCV